MGTHSMANCTSTNNQLITIRGLNKTIAYQTTDLLLFIVYTKGSKQLV